MYYYNNTTVNRRPRHIMIDDTCAQGRPRGRVGEGLVGVYCHCIMHAHAVTSNGNIIIVIQYNNNTGSAHGAFRILTNLIFEHVKCASCDDFCGMYFFFFFGGRNAFRRRFFQTKNDVFFSANDSKYSKYTLILKVTRPPTKGGRTRELRWQHSEGSEIVEAFEIVVSKTLGETSITRFRRIENLYVKICISNN